MSDDDLIRRGDAVLAVTKYLSPSQPIAIGILEHIRRAPAVTPALVADEVAKEREACARDVLALLKLCGDDIGTAWVTSAAAAIRARKETP